MTHFLLIEDDPDYALIVQTALEAGLGEVAFTHLGTGRQALAQDLHPFDAIILDNNLPDMTGLEILENFAGRQHGPIVMVTGDDHIETAVQALKRGAEDFIIKSLDLERLLPHVVEKAMRNFRQRQLMAEIEVSERERRVQIETLKRVMMTLAHHLNNAIMPITFSAELCKRSNYDLEAAERLVKTCLTEIQRINAILERFEGYVESEEFKYTDYLDLKNAMFEV